MIFKHCHNDFKYLTLYHNLKLKNKVLKYINVQHNIRLLGPYVYDKSKSLRFNLLGYYSIKLIVCKDIST